MKAINTSQQQNLLSLSSKSANNLFAVLLICLAAISCTKKKPESKGDDDENQTVVTGTSSAKGILSLNVSVDPANSKGKLYVLDLPKDASLTCGLDEKRLDSCSENYEFELPSKAGQHKISAIAKVNNRVVAVGEVSFSVGQTSSGQSFMGPISAQSAYASDLSIDLDSDFRVNGRRFQNGTWIKKNDEITFKFHFKQSPRCSPKVRCISDIVDNAFKPLCDSINTKRYQAGSMALGLQYLRVEASCGDKVGEPMILYWYGVPDNYTYMAISTTAVFNDQKKQKRYIFTLMKPNDCPENKLSFRCRRSASASFEECSKNYVDNPAAGFAVMPICNNVQYPPYMIN